MTEAAVGDLTSVLKRARGAQQTWSRLSLSKRLGSLRTMRMELARRAQDLAAAMPSNLQRTVADTLIAEILPLLDACKFLERNAAAALASRTLDDPDRSNWFGDVAVEIYRDPLGVVLIIGPANYPLFIAGVQCLQAMAAGNAVLWKPAPGSEAVAQLFASCWQGASRDHGDVTQVLSESTETATSAIQEGVDRVFLTGSAATGQAVMSQLAATQTSAVMELSGCDAVFILDGASIERAVAALVFGMRFNGSATCMAPRRLFVPTKLADNLVGRLASAFGVVGPRTLPPRIQVLLAELISDAAARGAVMVLDGTRAAGQITPTLIDRARPEMRIMQTDIFAPVLAVMRVADMTEAMRADAQCPYALTAAIFGPEKEAHDLAVRINAGTIFINDLIVPSADPRAPFGGRKRSGFGVTRGIEGLLAMTNVKTVLTQCGTRTLQYQPTTPAHERLFSAYIAMRHASDCGHKLAAIPRLIRAAIAMNKPPRKGS